MATSISELIYDYERAKLELEKLISENSNLNDTLVRDYDKKVDLNLKKILNTPLYTGAEVFARIRYLLTQIESQNDNCGITANMIKLIEADLGKLAPSDEYDLAQDAERAVAQNTDNLIEVCYRSKSCIKSAELSLEELHGKAIENNRRDDITGILVYDDDSGSFLQVLEGPKQKVHNLLVRLLLDSRHENISVQFEGPIEKRMYTNWSLMLATTSHLKSTDHSCTENGLSLNQLKDISDASDVNSGHQWLMATLHSAMANGQQ